MARRLRYVLLYVLYAVSAGLTVIAFTGDGGQPVVPGLLLAALAIGLTLGGIRWTERRRERHQLSQVHGLSAYDTRMAMHLVDVGSGMRAQLRPTARDYAERQLAQRPTSVLVMALGATTAVALYIPYAAIPGGRVVTIMGFGVVGYLVHHAYTRPERLHGVLASLDPARALTRSRSDARKLTPDVAPPARAARSVAPSASTKPGLTSRIRLRRPWAWRNYLSEYIVEIDGRSVGKLRSRASADYPVAPGNHDVRVGLDTTGYPEKGYLGSPTFDTDLADGEHLELDVIALPASYSSFGVQQSTDDPEKWLLLAPADTDRPPAPSRLTRLRENWFRYMLGLASSVALLCTWLVFPTGSAAWWNSQAVVLLGAGTLLYFRFGRSRTSRGR